MSQEKINAREALSTLVQDFKERMIADEEWGESGYDFPETMPRFSQRALDTAPSHPKQTEVQEDMGAQGRIPDAPEQDIHSLPVESPRESIEPPREPKHTAEAKPVLQPAPSGPPITHETEDEATIEPMEPPSIDQLAAWRKHLNSSRSWPLNEHDGQWLLGKGDPSADILFVAERVHESDTNPTVPFSGTDGALLDKMVAAMGYTRENVFLVTLLPPNQQASPQHNEMSLKEHLAGLVFSLRPKVIVTMGKMATQTLLETEKRLSRMRGRWANYVHADIPVMPTYHPAALIRNAHLKRPVWEDLQKVMSQLNHLKS